MSINLNLQLVPFNRALLDLHCTAGWFIKQIFGDKQLQDPPLRALTSELGSSYSVILRMILPLSLTLWFGEAPSPHLSSGPTASHTDAESSEAFQLNPPEQHKHVITSLLLKAVTVKPVFAEYLEAGDHVWCELFFLLFFRWLLWFDEAPLWRDKSVIF